MNNRITALAVTTCCALALAACGGDDPDRVDFAGSSGVATDAEGEVVTTGPQIGKNALELEEGYVEAKPAADAKNGSATTSIYGTLRNTTTGDVELTGFTTSLGTSATYEIHETVDGEMRKREGNIIIPAGGTHEFAPGGDHLMILDYDNELPEDSTLDLTFDMVPQQKVAVSGVPVRAAKAEQ